MQNGAIDVLNQFRQGSPEAVEAAFETLFRQHQHAVCGWILRITRSAAGFCASSAIGRRPKS
jgi:hypothetical protein